MERPKCRLRPHRRLRKVVLQRLPQVLRRNRSKRSDSNGSMEKDIRCPRCAAEMTFQGVQSVGVGVARLRNVEIYLCSKCGCIGRFDERAQRIIEIT